LQVRLQKFLAQSGVASRRASEDIILKGRVKVNGEVVKKLGIKIDPKSDKVEVDGVICRAGERPVYILLNKPQGVLTTVKDTSGRTTVIDLIKGVQGRFFPVGRLDKDTEGLLILTNDGGLTYKLTHPKYEVPKTYLAHIKGNASGKKIAILEKGIELEDGITAPAQVRLVRTMKDSTILNITIHEGKNRQIRRMCEAIGHPVIYLKRTHIGKLSIQGLNIGEWRHLKRDEIKYLKNL